MVTHPDPVVLYPDVATRGSLGAALQAAAERGGFSVPVTASTSDPLGYATVESTLPHRRALLVSSSAIKRRWSIRGEESFQGMALIEGGTEDLAQVARAAQAWHEGVALSDIRQAAPFVHLTGRFEVPDHDPVRLTESEWQHVRTEASTLERPWDAYHALVEAAYAEPALRGLYPFTSHWVLRFSTTTRPNLSIVGPCLLADDVDQYTVSATFTGSVVIAQATTAQEAVAAAVRELPSGLGPVTSGALLAENRRELSS
ncbi:hypothetical protein HRW16_02540 [Streptomyces lunaelactis]|uniref:DUF6193 family natural product biosynthesis protein n=1 Tax=Streptomyces lunaelactis TaxID=1535768 RepID=UPI001585245E|nr:DUF6193 family natural product biosynthesis protein [Streptomyces lunaelactis]NUK33309.1 hypothetical protein [Streptomyces lunaelactis]NUK39809.1 hypothetical protein [Streptomyces lunaelactis]NUK90759.1 hypothetical protein [Streptomyces lunaelactis]NUL28597.1 hypothetical protein [Streptomyces lunaelactis]